MHGRHSLGAVWRLSEIHIMQIVLHGQICMDKFPWTTLLHKPDADMRGKRLLLHRGALCCSSASFCTCTILVLHACALRCQSETLAPSPVQLQLDINTTNPVPES